jgi:alanyl aminopeptidase
MTRAFLDDPSSVDAQNAGVALRVAAHFGDRELYEKFRQGFEGAEDPAVRRNYLNALGAFMDPALQDSALDYALGGQVRLNELFPIFGSIMSTPAGQDRVYNWFTSNYDEIVSRMPPMFVQYMPFIASGCSTERLAAAREFFGAPERSTPGLQKNLAKVADQVTDCAGLREREGQSVADYLNGLAAAR